MVHFKSIQEKIPTRKKERKEGKKKVLTTKKTHKKKKKKGRKHQRSVQGKYMLSVWLRLSFNSFENYGTAIVYRISKVRKSSNFYLSFPVNVFCVIRTGIPKMSSPRKLLVILKNKNFFPLTQNISNRLKETSGIFSCYTAL